MLLRHAQPLFPLEDPGMTHSLLLRGDFVSVDVLASFADVNLGTCKKKSQRALFYPPNI